MLDENITEFLREFGQPTSQRFPTTSEVEQYRGVLPERLLEYWQEIGFSGYMDGLFWIVNPADYDDVLERFLEPTDFPEHDTYHVIARDAWGDLYLWGERTGDSLAITPRFNWMRTKQGDAKDIAKGEANKCIELFFAFQEAIDKETQDEDDKPMFEPAVKAHGVLAENELFAFNPFLFMGGNGALEDISKENIFVHLNLIADMGDMEVIDMASMISSTLKQHGE
jgi:hypothetical protein